MLKIVSVLSAAAVLGLTAQGAVAETKGAIPVQFRGAGCNLKYAYAKTPRQDASECVSNVVKKNKDDPTLNGDYFIRIGEVNVEGVDWGCTVREVKASAKTEFKFVGGCSQESSEFDMEVTLTLKPGAVVIVDTVGVGPEGAARATDRYHILPGLK